MSKKVLVEVELGPHQFQTSGCKKIIDKSAYAIAQGAMGHGLTYTCPECGCKTNI